MKRKRVVALSRAPDGSAFQTCEKCKESVMVALKDMHNCCCGDDLKKVEDKPIFKKFRGVMSANPPCVVVSIVYKIRSPFRFFMGEFQRNCDISDLVEMDRKGFEMWTGMSVEERRPYYQKAKMLDLKHANGLLEEMEDKSWMDDEGDSAQAR